MHYLLKIVYQKYFKAVFPSIYEAHQNYKTLCYRFVVKEMYQHLELLHILL